MTIKGSVVGEGGNLTDGSAGWAALTGRAYQTCTLKPEDIVHFGANGGMISIQAAQFTADIYILR